MLCCSLLAAAVATPAASKNEPTATLKLYSGSQVNAEYYGSGTLTLRKSLCLASETGSFRLRVRMGIGANDEIAADGASIVVKLPNGELQTRPLTDSEMIFRGSNLPKDKRCMQGPNAELSLVLPESALTAAPAGSYFKAMQMTVEPV